MGAVEREKMTSIMTVLVSTAALGEEIAVMILSRNVRKSFIRRDVSYARIASKAIAINVKRILLKFKMMVKSANVMRVTAMIWKRTFAKR